MKTGFFAIVAVGGLLGACTTGSRLINTIDVATVESSAISPEQQAMMRAPPETSLDDSALHNDAADLRAQLARTRRRLGVPDLAEACKAGSPDAYSLVELRGAWFSYEEAIVASNGVVTRVTRGANDGSGVDRDSSTRRDLPPAEWERFAQDMEAIGVRHFPAQTKYQVDCVDGATYAFETCLGGEERLTFDAGCSAGERTREQARQGSGFVRAEALLRDLAEAE